MLIRKKTRVFLIYFVAVRLIENKSNDSLGVVIPPTLYYYKGNDTAFNVKQMA